MQQNTDFARSHLEMLMLTVIMMDVADDDDFVDDDVDDEADDENYVGDGDDGDDVHADDGVDDVGDEDDIDDDADDVVETLVLRLFHCNSVVSLLHWTSM